MATHSCVLAWRIPGTGKPGGLPSMGSYRVGHDWSDLAAVAAAALPGLFRQWTYFVLQWWMYVIIHLSKFIEFTTPRVNPKVNCGLWVTVLCQFRFINCRDVDYGETLHVWQRRQWHPIPVHLPGKSHGWRNLVGCSPWGR